MLSCGTHQRHICHRGNIEPRPQGDIDMPGALHAGNDVQSQDRMTTQIEKRVVHPSSVRPSSVRPSTVLQSARRAISISAVSTR